MELTPVTSGMIAESGGMQQIGIAVLSKQLDTLEGSGDLLSASLSAMPTPQIATPGLGSNIDIRI